MAPTLLNKVKLTVELEKEKNTNAACVTGKFERGFHIHEVMSNDICGVEE
jgi:hypothetical protein